MNKKDEILVFIYTLKFLSQGPLLRMVSYQNTECLTIAQNALRNAEWKAVHTFEHNWKLSNKT